MADSADSKSSWNKQESWKDPHSYLKHTGANSLVKRAWLNHSIANPSSYPNVSSVFHLTVYQIYQEIRVVPLVHETPRDLLRSSCSFLCFCLCSTWQLVQIFLGGNSTGMQNWNLSHFLFLFFFMAVLTLVKLCHPAPRFHQFCS